MNTYLQRLVLATLLAAQVIALTTLAQAAPPVRKAAKPAARLALMAPRDGATYVAPARVEVEAVGLGRFGGITDVELVLDDRVVAESHVAFIRPPSEDEPVHHLLAVSDVASGRHRLYVRDMADRAVVSEPLSIEVLDAKDEHPSLIRLVAPLPGSTLPLGKELVVEAVATGPLGGITHVELLIDDRVAAESRVVFIRPPAPGEPVGHAFQVTAPLTVGSHRLQVRDATRPETTSETVIVHVVAPVSSAETPLLRLATLDDGTLLLVLPGADLGGRIRIQASTDLLRWEDVGGDAFAVPVPRLAPLAAPAPTRFYRALRESEAAPSAR